MSDDESLTQQRLTYLERELRVVRAELASLLACSCANAAALATCRELNNELRTALAAAQHDLVIADQAHEDAVNARLAAQGELAAVRASLCNK